ncbi:BTB/POZ protein [Paraphysoderma sedebokerense]|nr:BTB/POZ protein [Paraphysoderma sedebokerense]
MSKSKLTDQVLNDVVKLNVGGVRYETTLSTLRQHPDTFLSKMVSPDNRDRFPTKEDGSYFIDRDGDLFRYILDYYRCGSIPILNCRNYCPSGMRCRCIAIDVDRLEMECDFFGLEFDEVVPPNSPMREWKDEKNIISELRTDWSNMRDELTAQIVGDLMELIIIECQKPDGDLQEKLSVSYIMNDEMSVSCRRCSGELSSHQRVISLSSIINYPVKFINVWKWIRDSMQSSVQSSVSSIMMSSRQPKVDIWYPSNYCKVKYCGGSYNVDSLEVEISGIPYF